MHLYIFVYIVIALASRYNYKAGKPTCYLVVYNKETGMDVGFRVYDSRDGQVSPFLLVLLCLLHNKTATFLPMNWDG